MNKQLVIDKIWELSDYEDIEVAKKFVDCISQIWIDNQFLDFKFIIEDFNMGYPYIIYNEEEDIYLQTWGEFCEAMIDDVKEYYDDKRLNFDKILEIEL